MDNINSFLFNNLQIAITIVVIVNIVSNLVSIYLNKIKNTSSKYIIITNRLFVIFNVILVLVLLVDILFQLNITRILLFISIGLFTVNWFTKIWLNTS